MPVKNLMLSPSKINNISIVICLITFLGCHNKDQDILLSNNLTVRSKELIEKGNYDSAFLFADKAIRLSPSNFVAYNNRAFAEAMINFPEEEVISDYLKSLALKPDYDIALYSFANYLYSIKKYDSCIMYSKQFLELTSNQSAATKKVSNILSIKGESEYIKNAFTNAINDFVRAISIDSRNIGAQKILADCYLKTKNLTLAISHYTIAIKLDTNYFQAYLGRGFAYESIGELRLAGTDYEKALDLKPDLEDLYNTKSSILLGQIKQSRSK